MRILLDTHALLWWLLDDPHLSATARAAIGTGRNEVLASAASAWEIATKVRIEAMPIVTADAIFQAYGADTIW